MKSSSSVGNGKTVLILDDNLSLESVDDKIVALGHTFKKRTQISKPVHWKRFVGDLKQINASGDLLTVFIFLSKSTILNYCNGEYFKWWHELLVELKRTPSLIFIHQDNLNKQFFDETFGILIQEVRKITKL